MSLLGRTSSFIKTILCVRFPKIVIEALECLDVLFSGSVFRRVNSGVEESLRHDIGRSGSEEVSEEGEKELRKFETGERGNNCLDSG